MELASHIWYYHLQVKFETQLRVYMLFMAPVQAELNNNGRIGSCGLQAPSFYHQKVFAGTWYRSF